MEEGGEMLSEGFLLEPFKEAIKIKKAKKFSPLPVLLNL